MGFGKDGKGTIILEGRSQALLTLAQSAGILIGTKLVTLERFRTLKAEVMASISGLTGTEGNTLVLYLADGDLALSEIEEAIEVQGPLGPNDEVRASQAMRAVFKVDAKAESFGADPIATGAVNRAMILGTINPRWTFSRTKSWNWVLYNVGPALTTGATVLVRAKNFGVWVT